MVNYRKIESVEALNEEPDCNEPALLGVGLAPSMAPPVPVIVNYNAGGTGSRLLKKLSEVEPYVQVYYTKTLDELRYHLSGLIEQRVPHIFSAGGDGTLTHLINIIQEIVEEKNALLKNAARKATRYDFPKIGVLKYGTGNAVARLLGVKRGIRNLTAYVSEQGYEEVKKVSLIKSGGTIFPFAGIGMDAMVLNDYQAVKRFFGKKLRKLFSGALGYFATTFLYSAPKYLITPPFKIRVINTGDTVYKISYGSKPIPVPVNKGDTLYEGACTLAGAGTVPYYGFGLKAFPFALTLPDHFNLRIINMSSLQLVRNSVSIFKGKILHPGFVDFLVKSVKVILDRRVPYHISGDPQGLVQEVEFKINDEGIELFDFNALRSAQGK